MKKVLFVLALTTLLATLNTPTATANNPLIKCYNRMDYGVIFTNCSDGYYARTNRIDGFKYTTWYNKNIPFYKVTCKGINDRGLQPITRCRAPQVGLHNK